MFGISFGELLLIATIGLIIVGPKRLPEAARFIGHLFSRIQRQVNTVKADIQKEMAVDDLKNIHRQYEKAANNTHDAFRQAAMEMGKEAENIRQTTTNTANDVKTAEAAEVANSAEAANTPNDVKTAEAAEVAKTAKGGGGE